MAIKKILGAVGLNVGENALNRISQSILTTNDIAVARGNLVGTGGGAHSTQDDSIHFYRYEASRSDAEIIPYIVKPLDASSVGRWFLISPSSFMEDVVVDPAKKVVTNVIVGNDSGLTIGWDEGAVDIVISDIRVTVSKETNFQSKIISTVAQGTEPIEVSSTTVCPKLNSQYVGGQPVTNLSLLVDPTHTNKYADLPRVTNATTVYPTDDSELVTKKYVDDELRQNPSDIDHGTLIGRADDDHTQYVLVAGNRLGVGFTDVVSGVTPTINAHLTTKGYVDGKITSEMAATGQFLRSDGSNNATAPLGYSSNLIVNSAGNDDFITKYYVDFSLETALGTGSGPGIYLRRDGGAGLSTITGAILVDVAIGATQNRQLITRGEVDTIIGAIVSSDTYVPVAGVTAYTWNIVRKINPTADSGFTPTTDFDLTTKKWVDDEFYSFSLSFTHDLTPGAAASTIHTNFPLLDGTRAFTGKIAGITPLNTDSIYSLVTREYVDALVGVSGVTSIDIGTKGDSTGSPILLSGSVKLWDRTAGRVISSTPFADNTYFTQMPYVVYSGADPTIHPTNKYDLVHKMYVDDRLVDTVQGVLLKNGTVSLDNNMAFFPKTYLDYYYTNNPNILSVARGSSQVISKGYVDRYVGVVASSTGDDTLGYLGTKIISKPTYTAGGTTVNPTINVANVEYYAGAISRYYIGNGGSATYMFGAFEATSRQNINMWDGSGVSATHDEMTVQITDGTNPSIQVSSVYGGVWFMEQAYVTGPTLTTTGDGNHTMTIEGDGSGALWRLNTTGTAITDANVATAPTDYGLNYTNARVTGVAGVNVVGNVVQLADVDTGGTNVQCIITNVSSTNGAVYTVAWTGVGSLASSKADGSYTATTTIVSGGNNGTLLTISFDVASNLIVSSSFAVVNSGSGYYSPTSWWFLRPRVYGQPVKFDIVSGGATLTLASYRYNLDETDPLLEENSFFTWTGDGATAGDLDYTDVDVTFLNPSNEKLEFEVRMEDTAVPGTFYTLRVNNGTLELVEVV